MDQWQYEYFIDLFGQRTLIDIFVNKTTIYLPYTGRQRHVCKRAPTVYL